MIFVRIFFKDLSNYPLLCLLNGPWSPLIWTNLNPHLPQILPTKFGW